MNLFDKKIFNDVLNVIYNLPKDIQEKIPKEIVDSLEENKDQYYTSTIDFSDENWIKNLNKETSGLLALLYRDYIVSEEEHNKLLQLEKQIQIKKENEKSRKYSIENIFKRKK